jgi:signal transduction histidine kinase
MDGVNAIPEAVRAWVRDGVVAAARALAYGVVSQLLAIALFVLSLVSLALTVTGVGIVVVPVVTAGVRQFANLHRRLAREWAGVDIPEPYRPPPPGTGPDLSSASSPVAAWRAYRRVVTDPATWRDIAWLVQEMTVGFAASLLPAALIGYGLEGALGVALLLFALLGNYGYGFTWMLDTWPVALLTIPQGAFLVYAGLILAPHVPRWHFLASRALLAPTRSTLRTVDLTRRVRHLAETRADAVATQAAELRRIERDLHDGAQARLVGLGMSIGLAAELMTRDPEQARHLLAEAREASGQALTELRNLVRGIHPPVLAERGLDGAVRALALTVPLPVDVDVDLPGRPPAPVESAVYFGIAEALANAVKHGRAGRAWIRLRYADGTLTAEVGDDGAGGADPARGTGLAGVRRRLAAFDATMSVASPPGGPTVVTLELPCALSSPKTSPSSGTG